MGRFNTCGRGEWQPFSPDRSHALALVMVFVTTPCAASMDGRPPDLRLVRVVHSFTGRVLFEATHPRLGQVRVFLLKQWTWNSLRRTLPEGFSKFNIDLIYNGSTPHALRALMSLTDEDILVIGYVIKELRVPSPRTLRDMTEAISRHQADLVYNFLSRYKVPEVVRVLRGETISPLSLLLMVPWRHVEDVRRCPRALESLLAARCSPNLLGSPARAPLSIAVASNDLESVEELLEYRANPDIASEGEEPPLCSAVRQGRRAIVSALLQHRADCNIRWQRLPPLADGQGEQGPSPLELAAGDESMVELLAEFRCTQYEVMTSALDS